MAIVEKRQLFRLDDDLCISYRQLENEDVNEAIKQLSLVNHKKSLFPKIEPDQQPTKSNITVFGISFFAKSALVENSHISLAFLLSASPQPLYAVGQVAYCKFYSDKKKYKIGVRFKFLPKPDMQLLEEYLVLKLQEGMSKHLPGYLPDEETWLFDHDMKDR